jgi:type II secretory pathway component GspD/PulD (secretin)
MKAVLAAVFALFTLSAAFAASEKRISRPLPGRFRPLTVTLDVKDEDVRDIMKSMQRQCGIKNLIIDPQVQGKGTFFFKNVPCNTAFETIFRSLDLKSVVYSSSMAAVEKRH